MTKKGQIWKCNVCGNIVEVLHPGQGELICCGQPMEKMEEKNKDEGQEKHVPVVEKTATGIKIKVGSIPHPMEEEHFIEWIELIAGDKIYRKFLKPGQAPEAMFEVEVTDVKEILAREYCNVHGLWQN